MVCRGLCRSSFVSLESCAGLQVMPNHSGLHPATKIDLLLKPQNYLKTEAGVQQKCDDRHAKRNLEVASSNSCTGMAFFPLKYPKSW